MPGYLDSVKIDDGVIHRPVKEKAGMMAVIPAGCPVNLPVPADAGPLAVCDDKRLNECRVRQRHLLPFVVRNVSRKNLVRYWRSPA